MPWLDAFGAQAYKANTSKKSHNYHIAIWSYGLRRNADWYAAHERSLLTICRQLQYRDFVDGIRRQRLCVVSASNHACEAARPRDCLQYATAELVYCLSLPTYIYICVCFRVIISFLSFDFRTSLIAVHHQTHLQTPHFDLEYCKLSKLASKTRNSA